MAFAYSFSMILIEIQDTLKRPPAEYVSMTKATRIGIFITTAFYMSVGCISYAGFGNDAPGTHPLAVMLAHRITGMHFQSASKTDVCTSYSGKVTIICLDVVWLSCRKSTHWLRFLQALLVSSFPNHRQSSSPLLVSCQSLPWLQGPLHCEEIYSGIALCFMRTFFSFLTQNVGVSQSQFQHAPANPGLHQIPSISSPQNTPRLTFLTSRSCDTGWWEQETSLCKISKLRPFV